MSAQYSAPRYDDAFDMKRRSEVELLEEPSGRTGITASWILRKAILTWFATS
jgi:hypothetical protein